MERLIAIVGPTAVGKTNLGIDLAKKMQTEIISGDSMLVYQGFNIGTAKPSIKERQDVPHYLIDILGPNKEFSVADFQNLAADLITTLNRRNKIPVLVGGTGLYLKALLEGYRFNSIAGNDKVRQDLLTISQSRGSEYLYAELTKVLPETAARLHPNDCHRVIRALEIYQLGGQPAAWQNQPPSHLVYDAAVIGLTLERQQLYQRIDHRVDMMIADGLIAEVSQLLKNGVSPDTQAMQAIGYKQIVAYLQGETDLTTAINQIKQATRNFAKRQLTWFRKMPYIEWITADTFDDDNKMLAYIYNRLAGKFNLE